VKLDEIGDALNGVEEDLVGLLERLEQRQRIALERQELLVGDRDERVDGRLELLKPLLGGLAALVALEEEGLGDDGHRQGLHLPSDVGDHRRRAGAGAATHAGGDEDHVGALEELGDLVARLGGGLPASLRVGAGAQPAGQLLPDLQPHRRAIRRQRLDVGVEGDEVHPLQARRDHRVDRVAPRSADADDADPGGLFALLLEFIHETLWELGVSLQPPWRPASFPLPTCSEWRPFRRLPGAIPPCAA